VQKCQQEVPSDTKAAPGARGRQRQAPDKHQPGATTAHRLAGLGHRQAVDGKFGYCFAASAWR